MTREGVRDIIVGSMECFGHFEMSWHWLLRLLPARRKNTTSVTAGSDIFERVLCLPSDNKMTAKEQNKVIEIVGSCFE